MKEELEAPYISPDSRGMELIRVWIIDGKPTFAITPNLWDDPAPWGLMLADIVRHLGNAYSMQGKDREATMKRIKELFDVEWNNPTSQAKPR